MPPEQTSSASDGQNEIRVLVVAPTGRDAALLCQALSRADMQALECRSCEAACLELQRAGAGTLIIAEEALSIADIQRLAELMSNQPAWSDFPLILLTLSGEVTVQSQRRRLVRAPLVRALELERPIRPETLISTVQNALRARHRQYEIRDYILQERNAEEALRRSEKLAVAGRLAATIAHEINNPLEAVINLVYLARTSRSQKAAREYLERAESELGRVAAIASETLKFYRQPNRATETQIPEILRSLLALYRDKIAGSKVELRTDFKDVPPIVAFGGELRQVFSNLLTNAIDAAAGGRIDIRLRHARDRSGRKGVKVLVADTGPGIPESVKSSIFEPFVSTKATRGTGLGLWVSSEIVRKHGGSIRVRSSSKPDLHGTVFCVFLPQVPDSTQPRAAAS
ncbi:MAG TPA: HAMP domain-containing sensor histidine kinase [Terriglobales bacterium]|nr:HAMP domain-containing sensor histidine kinase [Terriglobales bacterium]